MEKIISYELIDNKIIKFNFTENKINDSSEQDGGWGKSRIKQFWEIDEELDELMDRIDDGEELEDPEDFMYLLKEISVSFKKLEKLLRNSRKDSTILEEIEDDLPYFLKKIKRFLKSFRKIYKSKRAKEAIKFLKEELGIKSAKNIKYLLKKAYKFRIPKWMTIAVKFY
tara:strand:+ start:350 stop:856 length:507 start_codon:yes stop_codon:yes gene_type:complete